MLLTQTVVVTVASSGTPEALAAVRTPALLVYITALSTNAAAVYVGGGNPTSPNTSGVLASTKCGIPLLQGETLVMPTSAQGIMYDLAHLYVDGTTNDAVSVSYGF